MMLKKIMLKMMMFGRRTDPKTGAHTLRWAARSKCPSLDPLCAKILPNKNAAGLGSRNRGPLTRAALCENWQASKCRRPRSPTRLCASLGNIEAHAQVMCSS